MSYLEQDRRFLADEKKSLEISETNTNFHPLTRDRDSDLSGREQALEGAAYDCKHKLAPHDIGLEDPEWVKIRDEKIQKQQEKQEQDIKERDKDLALQQQCEPMDFSDPDG